MTSQAISNSQDVIDVRDVIARFEELENELQELYEDDANGADGLQEYIEQGAENGHDESEEFVLLQALLSDLKGNGGDEEWRGDWYPVTLIRDSYFKDYAQELADDIGAIDAKAQWPMTCIDWEQAARELRMDYSPVEFDGVTYWCR